MVYAQPRIHPGEWDTLIPLGFWDTNRSSNLGHTIRPYYNQQQQQQQKRTRRIVEFGVLAYRRVQLKENEKKDKYLDLAKKLKKKTKKLWNMKTMAVLIVVGVIDTVTKGLLKGPEDLEIRDRVETIQTTTLYKSARILRRVLETGEDLLLLKIQWKTIS